MFDLDKYLADLILNCRSAFRASAVHGAAGKLAAR